MLRETLSECLSRSHSVYVSSMQYVMETCLRKARELVKPTFHATNQMPSTTQSRH